MRTFLPLTCLLLCVGALAAQDEGGGVRLELEVLPGPDAIGADGLTVSQQGFFFTPGLYLT